MFTVYVLHSEKHDKIYVGYTTDLVDRFKSHNKLGTKGWTLRYRPWKMIHTEVFQTKKEALIREKQLKAGKGRQWIRNTLLNG